MPRGAGESLHQLPAIPLLCCGAFLPPDFGVPSPCVLGMQMEHSVRHIKEGGADASTAGESDPKKQGQAKPSSGSSGFDK